MIILIYVCLCKLTNLSIFLVLGLYIKLLWCLVRFEVILENNKNDNKINDNKINDNKINDNKINDNKDKNKNKT